MQGLISDTARDVIAISGFAITIMQAILAVGRALKQASSPSFSVLPANIRLALLSDLETFNREYNDDARVGKLIAFVTLCINTGCLLVGASVPALNNGTNAIALLASVFQCFALTYIYFDFLNWLKERRHSSASIYEATGAAIWLAASFVAAVVLIYLPTEPEWAPAIIQATLVIVAAGVVLLNSFWRLAARLWES
jgi:hypothetical protein